MPQFKYKARDANGLIVQGKLDAYNADNVAKILQAKKVIPVDITQLKTTRLWSIHDIFSPMPRLQDMIILSGQLHSLTKSGVSIINAISVLHDMCENVKLKQALSDVMQVLASGLGLSQALRQHPRIFSPLFISLVEIGENTGQLDQSFLQIKNYLYNELHSKRKLKAAIRYPIIVMVAISIAVIVINGFVVPSFKDFFDTFDAALPWPTRLLIGFSDLFIHYGWLLVVLLVLLGMLAINRLKTPQGQLAFATFMLKIPWLGGFIERAVFSRFCRCFGMVLQADVPLLKGLHIVSQVVKNPVLHGKVQIMSTSIQHGESLLQAARASRLFSPLVLQMLAVGENTGELDKIFFDLADHYDMELDYDISRIGEVIEPLLIMIIAVMVLVLALGVFLPMWDISTVAFNQ